MARTEEPSRRNKARHKGTDTEEVRLLPLHQPSRERTGRSAGSREEKEEKWSLGSYLQPDQIRQRLEVASAHFIVMVGLESEIWLGREPQLRKDSTQEKDSRDKRRTGNRRHRRHRRHRLLPDREQGLQKGGE